MRHIAGSFLAAACGLLIASSTAVAAPPRVAANVPASAVDFDATAAVPDGGLVVFGHAGYFLSGTTQPCEDVGDDPDCSDVRPLVARYRADGSLDPRFGGGTGYVLLPPNHPAYSPGFPQPADVAVGRDGAIVVYSPGSTISGPASQITRLDPDGTVDTTFGDAGSFEVPETLQSGDAPGVLAIDSAGRVLLVGGNVLRLNQSGQPDPSFGDNGIAAIPGSRGAILALRPDDSMVVVNQGAFNSSAPAIEAVRLDASGTVDPSFGDNGVSSTPIPDPGTSPPFRSYHYRPRAISLDGVGRAVILLERDPDVPDLHFRCGDGRVIRLGADGTLDTAFGKDGFAATGNACARDLVLLNSGELLSVSTAEDYSPPYYLVESPFTADGQVGGVFHPPAPTLSVLGKGITSPSSISQLSDGRLVIAGAANTVAFLLAQRPDGQVDSGFGTNGLATLPAVRICSTPFEFCGYPGRTEFHHLARKGISSSASFSVDALYPRFTCLRDIEEACGLRATITLPRSNHVIGRLGPLPIDPHNRLRVGVTIKPRDLMDVQAASHIAVHATFTAAHQQPMHVMRRVKVHVH